MMKLTVDCGVFKWKKIGLIGNNETKSPSHQFKFCLLKLLQLCINNTTAWCHKITEIELDTPSFASHIRART
uniref:Uncharacterized protein n=1 Tax=Anguilla anguilla TaxID=7936 RepID=A0A0E9X4K4_ANGAN